MSACDVGRLSENDACLRPATHYVRGWGRRLDEELHVCDWHARDAESDGCLEVCDEDGEPVTWDGEADCWRSVWSAAAMKDLADEARGDREREERA